LSVADECCHHARGIDALCSCVYQLFYACTLCREGNAQQQVFKGADRGVCFHDHARQGHVVHDWVWFAGCLYLPSEPVRRNTPPGTARFVCGCMAACTPVCQCLAVVPQPPWMAGRFLMLSYVMCMPYLMESCNTFVHDGRAVGMHSMPCTSMVQC